MSLNHLQRILNHQHILYYNVPYGDESYGGGYAAGKADCRREIYKELFDIPIQMELGEKFPFAGYVTIEGKIYSCEPCQHEQIIRKIVYTDFMDEYMKVPASFYDKKPQGMLQEEYFAMKYLGFVKVSSFENAPLKRILFRYGQLTYKQSNIIFLT